MVYMTDFSMPPSRRTKFPKRDASHLTGSLLKKGGFFSFLIHPSLLEPAFTAYLVLQILLGSSSLEKEAVFSWIQGLPLPPVLFCYLLLWGICLVFTWIQDSEPEATGAVSSHRLSKIRFSSCFSWHPSRSRTLLLTASAVFAGKTCMISASSETALAMMAFLAVVLCYSFQAARQEKHPASLSQPDPVPLSRSGWMVVALLGIGLFAFIGLVTVFRYLAFKAPGYDFGLFAQMFEQMRRTGLPLTSYERDGWLSHFSVHVSPVYYLVLPLYLLFPRPETLQLIQAAVVALGLFPLMKLAGRFGLKRSHQIAIALLYCSYPALSGSCFYDFHENCFLTLFLLGLFWTMEADCGIGVLISSLLVCSIKEDAPLFVMSVGLYYLFSRRRPGKGLFALLFGGGWMAGALWYLGHFGEGSMTYRFSNLLYRADGSMFDVIKTILLCPAYALSQCFEADRLPYLILLLLPFLFTVLRFRQLSELFLWIPIVLINLMPDYAYQHNIFFQYQFGACALLFFLFLLHNRDLPGNLRTSLCCAAVISSLFLFHTKNLPRLQIIQEYQDNRASLQTFEEAIALLPRDASVKASPYLVAHLWQWKELYGLASLHDTDYVLLDLRVEDGRTADKQYQHSSEWTCLFYQDSIAALYQKN